MHNSSTNRHFRDALHRVERGGNGIALCTESLGSTEMPEGRYVDEAIYL